MTIENWPASPPPPRRRGNGLVASNFVALADVDPRLGAHLLDLLRLADVPAYLEPTVRQPAARSPRDRLYVAGTMRDEALAVVAAAAEEAGGRVVPDDWERRLGGEDVLAGIDTDAVFRELVAGWDAPPAPPVLLPAPVEAPEEDEHYEPPPPPPLPRLSGTTVGALLLVLAGLLVIAGAGWLGLGTELAFAVGIVLVLAGFCLLLSRLRDGSTEDDAPDDDGAIV